MKPEASSATDQGKGQKRQNRPGQSVSKDEIPREHRALEGASPDPTEGALPAAANKPKTTRLEERPSRGINRGLHP